MKNPSSYILIIVTSLIVGIMNTILIRPEDAGTWKNFVGYLLLIIAVVYSYLLLKKTSGKK